MRKSEALVRMLCRPYCSYYKQDKNEDLLCRGAVVVERLILSGRSLFPAQETDRYLADATVREPIVHHLCGACDFRENDCSFAQDETSQPCGGFILLCGLVGQGAITIEDIR